MADYWISFRIADDVDYSKRYKALTKAITECATGGQWDADTSFVCIRSKYGIDSVGQHLKKALNATTDHLVIRRIDYKETGQWLFGLFPERHKTVANLHRHPEEPR